jgi:hypothetical protein
MELEQALNKDEKVFITTSDRTTGEAHKVRVSFYNIEDKWYFSGKPGVKNWYLNLVENPEFTFHLVDSLQADIPASATAIEDEAERKRLFTILVDFWNRQERFDEYLQGSPLVEFKLDLEQAVVKS